MSRVDHSEWPIVLGLFSFWHPRRSRPIRHAIPPFIVPLLVTPREEGKGVAREKKDILEWGTALIGKYRSSFNFKFPIGPLWVRGWYLDGGREGNARRL